MSKKDEEAKGPKSSVFVDMPEEIYRLKAEIKQLQEEVSKLENKIRNMKLSQATESFVKTSKRCSDNFKRLVLIPLHLYESKEEERVIQPKENKIPNFEGLSRGYIVERKTETDVSILSDNGRIHGPPHLFESRDQCKEAILSSKETDVDFAGGYIFYKIIECYK